MVWKFSVGLYTRTYVNHQSRNEFSQTSISSDKLLRGNANQYVAVLLIKSFLPHGGRSSRQPYLISCYPRWKYIHISAGESGAFSRRAKTKLLIPSKWGKNCRTECTYYNPHPNGLSSLLSKNEWKHQSEPIENLIIKYIYKYIYN